MLTLCPSSAPSETGLCLSGGWLLNQTLTFSFLRHEVCQMHKFFSSSISHSVCIVRHITYSLILSADLLCLYRGRLKNGFQLLWYCVRQEDRLCTFDSRLFFFCHNYRDHVKEMNRWMDRGGGGNIDHVLWARQSDLCGDGEELPLVFLSRDPPSQHSCPR